MEIGFITDKLVPPFEKGLPALAGGWAQAGSKRGLGD